MLQVFKVAHCSILVLLALELRNSTELEGMNLVHIQNALGQVFLHISIVWFVPASTQTRYFLQWNQINGLFNMHISKEVLVL